MRALKALELGPKPYDFSHPYDILSPARVRGLKPPFGIKLEDRSWNLKTDLS
jgi:hypothetical protein